MTIPLALMQITYLDDTGSDKRSQIVLVGAVLIRDIWMRELEAVCGLVVEKLIPPEKIEKFTEFHAAELFNAKGLFDGVNKKICHKAFDAVLHQVERFDSPCIYSALKKNELNGSVIGSASAIDTAFRMCTHGIQQWMADNDPNGLALFIFDDTQDMELKRRLRASFREFRPRIMPPDWEGAHRMLNIHDDMYFGPSVDSIGIQMADMCNYIIQQTIKQNIEAEPLFEIIRKNVICSKVEPNWSKYRHLFVEHQW